MSIGGRLTQTSLRKACFKAGTSWWCAGWVGADCSRAARQRQPPPPVQADRIQTQAAGTSAVARKPAAGEKEQQAEKNKIK